jgi:hypothetical protein
VVMGGGGGGARQVPALKDFENSGADAERDTKGDARTTGYERRATEDTPIYKAHMR